MGHGKTADVHFTVETAPACELVKNLIQAIKLSNGLEFCTPNEVAELVALLKAHKDEIGLSLKK